MPREKSRRKVKHYSPYGRSKILYIHGHGELRSNTVPLSFKVPHGVTIRIAAGPGVALSDDIGTDMMNDEPVPINLPLAWVDRPGQPIYNAGDEGRARTLYAPMECPNYTLLPPNGLQDMSHRSDVFQTTIPMPFQAIVNRFKEKVEEIIWTNCTVLRGPNGALVGAVMDDLGDV